MEMLQEDKREKVLELRLQRQPELPELPLICHRTSGSVLTLESPSANYTDKVVAMTLSDRCLHDHVTF